MDNKGTPAWASDLLEFGHNVALALALAAFGSLAFYVEAVQGPKGWNQYFGIACILLALAWGALSGNHLATQLVSHTRLKSRGWPSILIGGLCIGIGGSVVWLAPLIPDNNHLVALCDKYAADPTDEIHNRTECQRLYESRADYERGLRTNQHHAPP
jgi:peptidoglycan/LPS O-acetylase OafA/YrhL